MEENRQIESQLLAAGGARGQAASRDAPEKSR
jgi:hypothetical protein